MSKLIKPKKTEYCLKAHAFFYIAFLLCFLICSVSLKAGGIPVDSLMDNMMNIEIKGNVKNHDGEPLVGATISVKGANISTLADDKGEFSLTVSSANVVLIVSYTGYKTKEVPVGGLAVVEVVLQPVSDLDDVVVIGYGTSRKRDLTGTVGSVKESELRERPAPSLNQMIAGRVSGVQVNVNSGRPGGRNNVRVRGFSSINSSNNPLYVVDGVMLPVSEQVQNTQAIDFINPNDIVSVEVLKDASATAIYGARGANGVILITTKRGKDGVGRVTYNGDYSVPALGPNFPEFLNAKEYLAVEDLAYANMEKYDKAGWDAGKYEFRNPANARTDPRLFSSNGEPLYDTKWIDEVTQHKISQNHQLGFTGGNKDRSYSASFSYRDDQGLIQTSYMKRYAGRLTFDDQIKKYLKVGATLSYNAQEENLVDFDYGVMRTIAEALPFLPPRYPDGSFANNRDYPNVEMQFSPLTYLYGRKYILNTQTFLGSAYLNLTLAKGLEMRTVVGANIFNQGINQSVSRDIYITQRGFAGASNNRQSFWSVENYLTYNKKIGADHSLNAMAGVSWQKSNDFGFSASVQNFSSDFFGFNNLGAGSSSPQYGSGRSAYAFNSYFGRINYSLKDKYLLTVTGRSDGSSKFGENNKYAFFPSAAVAWRISEEEFLRDNNVISNLKLRVSTGVTGNSEIPPYSSLSRLSSGYATTYGNLRVGGTGLGTLANPDLRWEKTTQSDIGLELGILENRISLEADVYYRKTTDMLLDAPVPKTSGYATIRRNIGSMENKGLEITLNTVNISSQNFTWTSMFNISMNRNKVLSLATPSDIVGVGGAVFISPTNIIRVGEAVGSFKGLVRLGVWGEGEREEAAKFASYRNGLPILPGDIKYLDVNGDYAITDADRMIIGNGSPKGWGTFINNIRYKNFDFMLDIQYSYGNNTYELSTGSSEDRVAIANSYKTVLNAWRPDNQNTMIPEIRDTRAGYVINEDTHWLKDGSFIRGRNILLGYTFPLTTLQKWGMNRFRIYGSVQNFFLMTAKEVNGDPETVGTTFGYGAFSQGLTYHAYPKSTTFMIGLQLGL
ncbi:MAG: TonB-dependent receptor [Chitinophagaceae bacterium]|nr:TonB-dependent receptor [Chitinophagaceae bacterium]